ncbi:MAG: hypothetical protein ABW091_11100 [Microbacterium sp.]
MRRILPPLIVALLLVATGCAPAADDAVAPGPSASTSVPASATPRPTASGSGAATAAPAPTTAPVMPTVDPSAPPAPAPGPVPDPAPTRGPDEVDPADYNSYAIDTVNGGVPLPGIAFRTADGRTICGIFTWGHFSTDAGTATCTVDTYKEIYPQPYPDTGPFVMSVMVSPLTGTAGLFPDWFAQPAREIPVLPDGRSIVYEGTRCTSTGADVTCTVLWKNQGFTLSPTGYSYF